MALGVKSARSRLLTTGEVADLLNVRRRTVNNWIASDLVPYVKLPGGDYRIPLGALLTSLSGTYDLASELERLDEAGSEAGLTEELAVALAADER